MKALVGTLAGLALVAAACHQEPSKLPTSPAEPAPAPLVPSAAPPAAAPVSPPIALAPAPDADALWALAPEGATMGIVVAPRALAMAEHGWQDIEQLMAAAPELVPLLAKLKGEIQKRFGVSTLSLAAAGFGPGRGLASFGITEKSTVLILPVVDRDKFLAVANGEKGVDADRFEDFQCKALRGLYACAEDPSRLDTLGKGDLRAPLAKAEARGDIEIAGTIEHVGFALVAQLSRGAFVVRGHVDAVPSAMSEGFGRRAATVPTDAAGFASLAIQPLVAKLTAGTGPHPAPLIPGVTWADAMRAMSGVVELIAPGGADAIDVHIPLRELQTLATVVQHCAQLPLHGVLAGGKCHVSVPTLAWLAPDFWVENAELRARLALPFAHGRAVPMTAIGAELARGTWSLVFWGRGEVLASTFDLSSIADPADFAKPDYRIGVTMGARFMAMMNEVGGGIAFNGDSARFVFAVRTAWANPDDVVAKIDAIDPHAILVGRARSAAQVIADAAPTSPFAADFHAGASGLFTSIVPVGTLAGVAIPAFLDYMKRARLAEAEIHLAAIGKHAKLVYAETSAFPAGIAARLPGNRAAKTGGGNNCCGARGGTVDAPGASVVNRCAADPKAFAKDPVWSALDFSLDEPGQYQYEYESDGKTFTARAIGDADCDGHSATWELRGSIDAGNNPHTELVPPPPGVY